MAARLLTPISGATAESPRKSTTSPQALTPLSFTDAHNCTVTGSYTVGFWNEGIWLMISGVDVKCFGQNNGSAHVSVMSGVGPYTYIWSNGGTTADISNLAPGTYTVTVTDTGTGCFNFTSIDIHQPAQLICTPSSIPANCGLNEQLVPLLPAEPSLTPTTGAMVKQQASPFPSRHLWRHCDRCQWLYLFQ